MVCFGFAVAEGLTGTGFAHPKPMKKIIVDPIGSRWRFGLSDNRPNRRGVRSPSESATSACENSWIVRPANSDVAKGAEEDEDGERLVDHD